jgi:hypothetical protein
VLSFRDRTPAALTARPSSSSNYDSRNYTISKAQSSNSCFHCFHERYKMLTVKNRALENHKEVMSKSFSVVAKGEKMA